MGDVLGRSGGLAWPGVEAGGEVAEAVVDLAVAEAAETVALIAEAVAVDTAGLETPAVGLLLGETLCLRGLLRLGDEARVLRLLLSARDGDVDRGLSAAPVASVVGLAAVARVEGVDASRPMLAPPVDPPPTPPALGRTLNALRSASLLGLAPCELAATPVLGLIPDIPPVSATFERTPIALTLLPEVLSLTPGAPLPTLPTTLVPVPLTLGCPLMFELTGRTLFRVPPPVLDFIVSTLLPPADSDRTPRSAFSVSSIVNVELRARPSLTGGALTPAELGLGVTCPAPLLPTFD